MFGAKRLHSQIEVVIKHGADFLPLSAALMKIRSPAQWLINSLLSLKVEHGQFPQNRPESVRLLLSWCFKWHLIINTNTIYNSRLFLSTDPFKGANLAIVANTITQKRHSVLFSLSQSIIIWDKHNSDCPQTQSANQGYLFFIWIWGRHSEYSVVSPEYKWSIRFQLIGYLCGVIHFSVSTTRREQTSTLHVINVPVTESCFILNVNDFVLTIMCWDFKCKLYQGFLKKKKKISI